MPVRDSPAHISLVDGAAVLEREGRTESAPASMPLLAGDRIRTQNGRVEILFEDRSTLHLDTATLVDFQSDDVIRLLEGRVRVNITNASGGSRNIGYRIDAPSAWVQISAPGEYRVSILRGRARPRSRARGAARRSRAGERRRPDAPWRRRARLRTGGRGASHAYVFNSAAWDTFDRWSEARRDARLGVSSQYLPETVQSYATTFAEYGSWQNDADLRARVVPAGASRLASLLLRTLGHLPAVGLDLDRVATHGRGQRTTTAAGDSPRTSGSGFPAARWGPAWVSWAYAPGYVSWCPLGWNNRPVLAIRSTSTRLSPQSVERLDGRARIARSARGYVNVNVVNDTRIDARTRDSFVVRDTAPDFRGYAVPRSVSAIRTAGRSPGAVSASQAASPRADARAGVGRRHTPIGSSPSGVATDAAAEFSSRRSAGSQLSGPGYPNPARQPSASRSGTAATSIAPPPGSARHAKCVARSRFTNSNDGQYLAAAAAGHAIGSAGPCGSTTDGSALEACRTRISRGARSGSGRSRRDVQKV